MPKTHVAAIDLGATSGRVIVGAFGNDGLELTEVHRFPNAFHRLNGYDYWDPGRLFTEIGNGLREARRLFPDLKSCGVDTWGVDHALLDNRGRLAFPVHAYRDQRTEPLLAQLKESGDDRKLYDLTGLPAINYNSGLQLQETLTAFPALKEMVARVLFLPDYFNYLLTGALVNEFSILSTAYLLDVNGDGYSSEALAHFGIPAAWFSPPARAGRSLGPLTGDNLPDGVEGILVPGHDTSCAFEAIPRRGQDFIVSTGTWLLAGAMTSGPLLGDEAFDLGISNERTGLGGYRPCKILMGLWLLEQILPAFEKRPEKASEWAALIEAAESEPVPAVLIDTADKALFNPRDMRTALDDQLTRRGATPPTTLPAYTRLICDSLAKSIADTADRFAALAGITFENLVLVGGGSKNRLLCQRVADYSGLPASSFNLEATSVGNIGYQLLALDAVPDLSAFHEAIRPGLSEVVYRPRG